MLSLARNVGLAAVIGGLIVAAATAQNNPRDRSRDPSGQPQPRFVQPPAVEEGASGPRLGREGGIPREFIVPRDDTRSRQGTDDGMPELRVQPRLAPGGGGATPYWIAPHTQWKLGVYAYDTESGVVITRVVPRGAAARAGLEPGDRIVNVAGFQIGFVGNQLYPLGHELQRHAGSHGQVQLLVQNVRNRELMPLDVRLDRR